MSPYNKEFFKALSEASEHALIHVARSMAKDRNYDAFSKILDALEEGDGKSIVNRNTKVSISNKDMNIASKRDYHVSEYGMINAFAEVLKPNTEDVPGARFKRVDFNKEQSSIFDRVICLMEGTPHFEELLDAGASFISDPSFYKKISKENYSIYQAPHSAISSGNMQGIISLMDAMGKDAIEDIVRLIMKDGEATPLGNRLYERAAEALTHIDVNNPVEPGGVIELLSYFDKNIKESKSAKIRIDVLRVYLQNGNTTESTLDLIATPELLKPGGGLSKSMDDFLSFQSILPFNPKNAKHNQDANLKLLYQACASHCAPVVDAIGPIIKLGDGKMGLTEHALGSARGNDFDSQKFKDTLMVLDKHGETLDAIKGPNGKVVRESALMMLAAQWDHPSLDAKLVALLELGCRPPEKSAKTGTSKFLEKREQAADTPGGGERWDFICRSYKAKEAAQNSISDIFNSLGISP